MELIFTLKKLSTPLYQNYQFIVKLSQSMINTEYVTIVRSIIITSIIFFAIRQWVRIALYRWLGKRFDDSVTKQYRSKITRLTWLGYIIAIWIVFQSTNLYHGFTVYLSQSLFVNSQYLAINWYTVIRACILAYISFEILQIGRWLLKINQSNNEEYYKTIDGAIFHAGMVIIVLIVLASIGVWWKILLPIASVLWVGIWFGLQDVAKNVISGIVLLTSTTLKPWDWVTVHSYFGKIYNIWLRSSVIRTLDHLEIIVPNSHLTNDHLINRSYNDHKVRISIPVWVSYRSDVRQVTQALLDATQGIKAVSTKPEPDVLMTGFGSSSVDFELRVWINVKKATIPNVKSELYFAVRDQLKSHNIEIPYPQQDIRFRNAIPEPK